ncbi:unnamed protein product [Ectocarpus sp. 8 AP-2014]
MNSTNSLTARLMSRSGLNPIDPTLPPVHNMRIITLNPDMTDAEKYLHAARKALRTLEGANTDANRKALYTAMSALEGSEVQYFATRYIGKDRPTILQGWKTHFSAKVDALLAAAELRRTNLVGGNGNPELLIDAIDLSTGIAQTLKAFDELHANPRDFPRVSRQEWDAVAHDMTGQVQDVRDLDTQARARVQNQLTQPELDVMQECVTDAEHCLVLFKLLVKNKREVPVAML